MNTSVIYFTRDTDLRLKKMRKNQIITKMTGVKNTIPRRENSTKGLQHYFIGLQEMKKNNFGTIGTVQNCFVIYVPTSSMYKEYKWSWYLINSDLNEMMIFVLWLNSVSHL